MTTSTHSHKAWTDEGGHVIDTKRLSSTYGVNIIDVVQQLFNQKPGKGLP